MCAGWTKLLYLLCATCLAAGELKQLDRFRYLASFPLKKDIALHCNADLLIKYVPSGVARWMKDKEEVTGTERLSVDETYTLHIKQLQPADSGMYACVVAFPGGTEVISNEIKLSAGGKKLQNAEFASWLKNKGSVGGARNIWVVSAVSCVVIALLWVIIILIMCTRKGKGKTTNTTPEDEEEKEMGFSYDEKEDDGSASETEALVQKKEKKKKTSKKGSKKGKKK